MVAACEVMSVYHLSVTTSLTGDGPFARGQCTPNLVITVFWIWH